MPTNEQKREIKNEIKIIGLLNFSTMFIISALWSWYLGLIPLTAFSSVFGLVGIVLASYLRFNN